MSNKAKQIAIRGEYITLGQFLKFVGIVSLGSDEKRYLASNAVLVNGENENRRGKKLRPGDSVSLSEGEYEIIEKNESPKA